MKTILFFLLGCMCCQYSLMAQQPSLHHTFQHREAVKQQQSRMEAQKKAHQTGRYSTKTISGVHYPVSKPINLAEEGKKIRTTDIYYEKKESVHVKKR